MSGINKRRARTGGRGLADADWRTRTGGCGLADADWRTRTGGRGLAGNVILIIEDKFKNK
jgi:hypothetical protein